MNEFRFSEQNAQKLIKAQLKLRIPITAIIVISTIAFYHIKNAKGDLQNSVFFFFILCIISIYMLVRLFLLLKNGRQLLTQSIYIIHDDYVELIQSREHRSKIYFTDITFHKKTNTGYFLKSGKINILIPSNIDDYEEIVELLDLVIKD